MSNVWGGREWQDQELLKKFKKNNSIILDCKLAIEDYEDRNSVKVKGFGELNKQWKQEKIEKSCLSDLDMYTLSQEFLNRYFYLLKDIGEQNFIFYDDGTVEYRVQ